MLLITSRYGWRVNPKTGATHFHEGIDLDGSTGDPIVSMTGGVVTRVDRDGVDRGVINGNAVHIKLQDWRISYLHLDRVLTAPGAVVVPGTLIGTMGSTGRSTGSHLHLQVAVGGRTIDPLAIFRARGFPYRFV